MTMNKKFLAVTTATAIAITSIVCTAPAVAVSDCIPLAVGEVYTLPAKCDAVSLDTNIANITNGDITGRNPGSTTIAYVDDSGFHKVSIVVDSTKSGFYGDDLKGCTLDLSTTNYRLNVYGTSEITYATTTPDVITVTADGFITPLAEGHGNVIVTMADKTLNIPITVVRKKLQCSFQEFCEITLAESDVSVAPVMIDTDAKLTYLVGDTDIATVTSDGKVTPIAPGLTTVKIQAEDTPTAAGFTVMTYVHCTKTLQDINLSDVSLFEGDKYSVDIKGVKLKTSSNCIKIQGTDIIAVKSGVADVTAIIAATDTYAAQTLKFKVSVSPKKVFKLEFIKATLADTAKFHEKSTVHLELKSDTEGELPIRITCDSDEMYAELISLKKGVNTVDLQTKELGVVGSNRFTVVVGGESFVFSGYVAAPDFQITIDDTPQFLKAGEFVQIGYTVRAVGDTKELHGPLQLMLDGEILSTEQIDITAAASTKKSTIGVYIPQTLADGQHKLRLCIVLNGSTSALYDEIVVNTSNPNMGLSINGQIMSVVDTYVYSASKANMTLQLNTLNGHERIETISLNGKTYSVKQNNTTIDLALAKAEEQDIVIVVRSADGTDEKSYAITVIRANDDTAIIGEFEDTLGNTYQMNTDSTPYRMCLPTDVSKGALTIKVEDQSAKIVSFNGKPVNKAAGTCSILIPESGEITVTAEIQAGDASVKIPYSILITNLNHTPEVQILNSSEITNHIFGSAGVLVGNKLVPYGTESTSVEAAISTGHTKGLVVDLAVADYNYNQFLSGYIDIDDNAFPIHWNSFDGPVREQAANIRHGYIYVDNAAFNKDANITTYTITIADYADEFVEDCISKTTATVTFGVNVLADNFSLLFDDASGEIVVETTARDFMLTMRKSGDNGITWTEPFGCGLKTKVIDPGTIMYEVTLTDAMKNETVKTIVATLPGSENEVEGVNVFVSASRHADYVYINTLKTNTTTLDIKIADIFSY